MEIGGLFGNRIAVKTTLLKNNLFPQKSRQELERETQDIYITSELNQKIIGKTSLG